MKQVSIITSSTYNCMKEKGAYGCVVIVDNEQLKLKNSYSKSTGNRIELMAVIAALNELEILYPSEELNIQLTSKLSYLLNAFSTGKLSSNLQRGESLPNYDLWKLLFEKAIHHKWRVVKINSIALEHLHKTAANLASNCANNSEGPIDEGVKFSSRKIIPKAKAVFEFQDVAKESVVSASDEQIDHSVSQLHQLPIIESNDPPF